MGAEADVLRLNTEVAALKTLTTEQGEAIRELQRALRLMQANQEVKYSTAFHCLQK